MYLSELENEEVAIPLSSSLYVMWISPRLFISSTSFNFEMCFFSSIKPSQSISSETVGLFVGSRCNITSISFLYKIVVQIDKKSV